MFQRLEFVPGERLTTRVTPEERRIRDMSTVRAFHNLTSPIGNIDPNERRLHDLLTSMDCANSYLDN